MSVGADCIQITHAEINILDPVQSLTEISAWILEFDLSPILKKVMWLVWLVEFQRRVKFYAEFCLEDWVLISTQSFFDFCILKGKALKFIYFLLNNIPDNLMWNVLGFLVWL